MANINKFTTMNTSEFEIGKFYNIQPSCWSSRRVPACVKRMTKRKIVFEYIFKIDDKIQKTTVDRRLVRRRPHQCAEPYDIWSTIKCTFSDDICDKPSMWDDIK